MIIPTGLNAVLSNTNRKMKLLQLQLKYFELIARSRISISKFKELRIRSRHLRKFISLLKLTVL